VITAGKPHWLVVTYGDCKIILCDSFFQAPAMILITFSSREIIQFLSEESSQNITPDVLTEWKY
jgi:hypothetical protein